MTIRRLVGHIAQAASTRTAGAWQPAARPAIPLTGAASAAALQEPVYPSKRNPPPLALCSTAGYGVIACRARLAFPTMGPASIFKHISSICTVAQDSIDTQNRAPPGCLSHQETRKLLKLIKVEDLKKQLLSSGRDCMPFSDLIQLCKKLGAATSTSEAEEVARSLDEAGVILIFRDKVFLHPERVADLLANVMPLSLVQDNDPRKEELARLQTEKEEIDRIAHKQVRRMLWAALGGFSLQSLLFFRLTFWDLSWDVMEPITFFVTSSSLIAGFLFFILTHRDPSYQDLMHTILSSKQRKLMKKRNFNLERFKELQTQCCLVHSDKYHIVSHAV